MLTSNVATIFISIVTIIVLYADDYRIINVPRDADLYVDFLLVLGVIIFLIELGL